MIDRLIATPSVSSVHPQQDRSNRPAVDLLADWASGAGFACEVVEVGSGKVNLVARLGPGGDEGLVLAGHTDTVPCDPALWTSDPYRAEERAGMLYGLGSSDMKSFFALALEAARRVLVSGVTLRAPIVLLATADEESTMGGARALQATGRAPGRFAVIGEPTGLVPIRMHKGIGMFGITLVGRSGHSSNPAYGASALEGMADVLVALRAWRAEMQAAHRNPAFEVPVPTMNLGSIRGGDNPNRICGECQLWIDLRVLPGQDPDELREELELRVAEALRAHPDLRVEMSQKFEGIPPFETRADSPIVRACEELTGAPSGTVAFATEGPYLNALGCETVILGPGEISVAHQPDEHLPLDRVEPAIAVLERLIARFCV